MSPDDIKNWLEKLDVNDRVRGEALAKIEALLTTTLAQHRSELNVLFQQTREHERNDQIHVPRAELARFDRENAAAHADYDRAIGGIQRRMAYWAGVGAAVGVIAGGVVDFLVRLAVGSL